MNWRLLFITGGILAGMIVLLFFVHDPKNGLWFPFLVSGLACLLMGTAATYMAVKDTSLRIMAIPVALIALLFVSSIWATVVGKNAQDRQNEIIVEIRGMVDEGILTSIMREHMLKLLYAYQEYDGQTGFDELLRNKMDVQILDDLSMIPAGYIAEELSDSGIIRITELSPEQVTFMAQSYLAVGRNHDFNNIHQGTGFIQFSGTVNKEGIRYERQN